MNIIGGRRPHLRDHGRHRRYRRHPLPTAAGPQGKRRQRVMAYCTHAVLSGPAISRINESDSTNWWSPIPSRCPTRPGVTAASRSVSIAALLADTMLPDQQRRIRSARCSASKPSDFEPVGFARRLFHLPIWSRTGFKSGVSTLRPSNSTPKRVTSRVRVRAAALRRAGVFRHRLRFGAAPAGRGRSQRIYHALRNETFHSSVLGMVPRRRHQSVILKDAVAPVQAQVLHLDFSASTPPIRST